MSSAAQELFSIRWGILEAVRNRLGLTKEEARRIFNQFKGRSEKGEPGTEKPEGRPPAEGDIDMRQVTRYMRDTNERLDHIEQDLDYLKRQVDRVLAKI